MNGQLQYIFIDEFHYIFSSEHEYRDDIKSLPDYLDLGVRVCLLTATLPPALEKDAWRILRIPRPPKHVVRTPTTRRDIKYIVQNVSIESQDVRASDIARIVQGEWRHSNRKTLVFVPYTKLAEQVAELLGGSHVHGQLAAQEKQRQLDRFTKGEVDSLVATSCISEGWHCEGIRLGIHACPPDSLMTYVQQSGRCARGDGTGVALLVVTEPRLGYLWKRERVDQVPMLEYLHLDKQPSNTTPLCRRQIIAKHLDGDDRDTCTEEEERCDICDGKEEYGSDFDVDTATDDSVVVDSDPEEYVRHAKETPSHKNPNKEATKQNTPPSPAAKARWKRTLPLSPVKTRQRTESPAKIRRIRGRSPTGRTDTAMSRRLVSADNQQRSHPTSTGSPYGTKNTVHHSTKSTLTIPKPSSHAVVQRNASTPRPRDNEESVTAQVERQKRELSERQSNAQQRLRGASYILHVGLKEFIDFWDEHCAICWCTKAKPTMEDWAHNPNECAHVQDDACHEAVRTFCRRMRSPGYCWSCLLPKIHCDLYQGTDSVNWTFKSNVERTKGKGCRHPFTVRRLFYAVWKLTNTEPRERVRHIAGKMPENPLLVEGTAAFNKFYGGLHKDGDELFPLEAWTLYHMTVDMGLLPSRNN
jgi:superfamily II DNA/RNA helicase